MILAGEVFPCDGQLGSSSTCLVSWITGQMDFGRIPPLRHLSGNRVYQELSQITGLVISSVPNSTLTTVCIGTPKVRA
jgi:hypothetical protein